MNKEEEKKISEHLFTKRESGFEHKEFDREMAFYESITRGDIEQVKMFATPLCEPGSGTLSRDPVQNIKYHFTISAALIARFCIKSGMTVDEAYNLSDIYIMEADECKTIDEVQSVHKKMIAEYTRKMRRILLEGIYSKYVLKAIDYINDYLHDRLKISDTAKALNLDPSYLSRIFKEETKVTYTEYVRMKKIDAAELLLMYSNYSDLEIANIFSFSSQSYFIKLFSKYKGMTPKQYRQKYRMPEF